MSETAESDKFDKRLVIIVWIFLFVIFLFNGAVCPYIALKKVEKGELKTACVYVAIEKKQGTKLTKYEIFMDGKFYKDKKIIPTMIELPLSYRQKWASFPINKKKWDFLVVDLANCKQVQYIEIYDIFGFKKWYVYDYIG